MPNPEIVNGVLKIKPYSITELSSLYTVCIRTFKRWLVPFNEEIGAKCGRYFTIAQVRTILKCIGLPSEVTLND